MSAQSLSYSTYRVRKLTSVTGESLPDLRFLKLISETVDKLIKVQMVLEERAYLINGLDISGIELLDPKGEAAASFEKAEEKLKKFISYLEDCHESAHADPDLKGDHQDCIVMEFEKVISATHYLTAVMQDKRWEILEHDAEYDDVIKYDSIEEFLVELDS